MAKKDKKDKIILERVYNVPLRKEWLKKPKYKRAKKAVTALRNFISKHMKSENVKIGKYANLELWKNGIKNPPHHIQVICKKFEDGKVEVELEKLSPRALREIKQEVQKKEGKEEAKKSDEKKKEETKEDHKAIGKASTEEEKTKDEIDKFEKKVEEGKDAMQDEAKKIEKEELKELKKEHTKVHTQKEAPILKETRIKKAQFVPNT